MSDFAAPFDAWTVDTLHTASPEFCGAEATAAAVSTATGVVDSMISVPGVIHKPFLLARFFVMNAATVSGTFNVGLHDSQKHLIIATTGTNTQTGINAPQFVDVNDTWITPGEYYLSLAWTSATATFTAAAQIVGVPGAAGCLSQGSLASSPAIPDPAVWVSCTLAFIPFFGMTSRTTL